MLRSILDNLHCRVNSLENQYLVDVDMHKNTFNVRPIVGQNGFIASSLMFQIEGLRYYMEHVMALSHSNVDLDLLNSQLKKDYSQYSLREFLQQCFGDFGDNEIVLEKVEDSIFLPIHTEFPDVFVQDYLPAQYTSPEDMGSKQYIFGFHRNVLE